MSQPFLPHRDGDGHMVIVGAKAAETKRSQIPPGANAILVAWENGPGYLQLGGSTADATVHNQSIRLPVAAGMMTLRLGPDSTHVAWDGIDLHAVLGDGL